MGELRSLHKRSRKRNGRTARGVVGHATRKVISDYIKFKQRNVGYLASGWNQAARSVGLTLPSWIARHGGAGASTGIKTTATEIFIRFQNSVRFGSNTDLDRRIESAQANRAKNIFRRLDDFQKKQAEKFNRRKL